MGDVGDVQRRASAPVIGARLEIGAGSYLVQHLDQRHPRAAHLEPGIDRRVSCS
jgi:hypothetical protein